VANWSIGDFEKATSKSSVDSIQQKENKQKEQSKVVITAVTSARVTAAKSAANVDESTSSVTSESSSVNLVSTTADATAAPAVIIGPGHPFHGLNEREFKWMKVLLGPPEKFQTPKYPTKSLFR